MSKQETIVDMLYKLSLAYPHAKLQGGTFEIYAEALEGMPLDKLSLALKQASLTCEFFPTLHRIREIVTDMVFGKVPIAEEAWMQVVKWFNDGPRPIEPLIHEVVDSMGEFQLRRSENLVADRAHFLKLYSALRERERQRLFDLPAIQDVQTEEVERRYEGLQASAYAPAQIAGQSEEDVPMPESVREQLKSLGMMRSSMDRIVGGKADGKTETDVQVLPDGNGTADAEW